MSALCFNGYACLGCSYCNVPKRTLEEDFFSSINCAVYLSNDELRLIAKFGETDEEREQREEWEFWDKVDSGTIFWDETETRLRIDGGKFHAAKHGVPSGDHSIRAWRKRLYNKLGRRLSRELIREQIDAAA